MEDEPKRRGRPRKVAEEGEPVLLPVLILRGYWPEDGGSQVEPGNVVDLPADEARKVVSLGIAERADEF